MAQLIKSRLAELAVRATPRYTQENKEVFERIEKLVGTEEPTRSIFEKYLFSRADKPYQANKELRMIKALFNHGIEREMWDKNPVKGIKFFSTGGKLKYIPPLEDVLKILEISGIHKAYILTIILTVARVGEINNLKWEDIKADYLILRTRKAKNSNITPRQIPLSEPLKEVLKTVKNRGEFVFWNARTKTKFDYRKNLMKSLCLKAGVKRFGFHSLRHFGASRLAMNGMPITDIQLLLGHQRSTTTDIYLQSLGSMKQAAEKLTHIITP